MTLAGGISVSTAGDRWATGRQISTASQMKALPSPTTTASRAARRDAPRFITGQNPIRTGLTKVGMPGARSAFQSEDPTIAELLKPLGYATGQFGKNHLGDRDEFLPTMHGFDEFFGNLYHLNAEEEPELPTIRKIRPSRRNSDPEACFTAGRGRRRAENRGHRPPHQEAHGDNR